MSRINVKILFVAIGIWLGTATAFGQEETSKKNEVSIGVGLFPFLGVGCQAEPEYRYDIIGFSVTAQYMRQIAKGLDVGFLVGWYPAEGETDVSAMLAIRGNWVNKPSLKVYSELDCGGLWSTKKHRNGVYQYTLAGVNYSFGKDFFGQVEFGFGSKGLISVGVGYKF